MNVVWPYVPIVLSQTLATVFGLAGCTKLVAPKQFFSVLEAYGATGSAWSPRVGRSIITGELAIALFLQLPKTEFVGAVLAVMLLTIFAVAQVFVLFSTDKKISCGCFGSIADDHVSWKTLLRTSMYLMLALLCAVESQIFPDSKLDLLEVLCCRATVAILVIDSFAILQIAENSRLDELYKAFQRSVQRGFRR